MTIGEPDKGHKQSLVRRQGLIELVLIQSIGLTHLSLDTITVYRMMKTFLRHANKHLHRLISTLSFTQEVDYSQWESSQRTAR
jgi:TRAP-type uncharacterized transport system substrate-binding protein